jgi:CheY-like chemotaxis protein
MNTQPNDKNRVLIVDDEPGNIKILSSVIVDDEPGNIKILSSVLAPDYALSVATSGAQALQIAEVQAPDIVLLDMVMPEMDGIQVCEALKANEVTKNIPVIFVTRAWPGCRGGGLHQQTDQPAHRQGAGQDPYPELPQPAIPGKPAGQPGCLPGRELQGRGGVPAGLFLGALPDQAVNIMDKT